jgi:hypothetical protein
VVQNDDAEDEVSQDQPKLETENEIQEDVSAAEE